MSDALVSKTQKPAPCPFAEEWERGLDPWHADAFKGTPAEGAFQSTNPRKAGWYAIDYCGNVVGFVADGTPVATNPDSGVTLVIIGEASGGAQ